jgi:hypothetical protein
MKIKKNDLYVDPYPTMDIIPHIWNVVWPFEHFIFKRKINLYLF